MVLSLGVRAGYRGIIVILRYWEGDNTICAESIIFMGVLKKKPLEFLLWLSGLRTQHSVHEHLGLIPGLA